MGMANPMGGAELRFPIQLVLESAEHALDAPCHRDEYEQAEPHPALWWVTDDGTYLMSNGVTEQGEGIDPVYADGWGPGTDARDVLGGDDFSEEIDLRMPEWGEGKTFLQYIREAILRGNTHLCIEVDDDFLHFAIGTKKLESCRST
jgi:hypothetical protein